MPRNTSRPIVKPTTLKTLTKSMLAISLSVAGLAHAELYSSVTFFGDSLTDGGYFSPITQGTLGLNESGQFTTNPDNTWATSFAEQLGTTSVANTVGGAQTGNNYAIGGARAGVDIVNTDFGVNVPVASVNTQVNGYLTNKKVDPNGMYVVWGGANDLLAAATNPANAINTVSAAAGSQVAAIKALKDNGANYILVPNIPDIGLTPTAIAVGAGFQSSGTMLANLYNQSMYSGAVATGANIIPLDTFSLLQQVAANPTAYGFTNVTQAACTTASSLLCGSNNLVTPGANENYFFADGIHPSGRAHQMIADYASAVVTAPSLIGVLPHIATTAGLATNERLQSHINQIQSSEQKPARNLWATGEFENQDITGFEGDSNTQVLLGVDFAHPDSANAVTGLYGNITQKEFENSAVRTGLSNIELEEVGFGVYHSNTLDSLGGVQLNGAVGFGNMDIDVTRAVTLGGNKQAFKSNADGKRYYANLQAGYPMQVSSLAITPYIGATASRVRLDALKEQEMSGIAMQFDEQKYTTTYGKLGVKANHNLADTLNLFGDVHYQKQLSDNRKAASARLNTISNISFDTPMVKTDDDNFGMTLGVSKSFGLLNANAGVTHSQGDDDKSTSLFVGLSGAF
ncbi:autotransporter domain-containing protein [Psychrobacter sp. DAB_AL62B]|uniref:autotransporter domain-containing protein n=1 Tax=Psychrobacter sp. DAB_AL62B TaxID=1028420 RepID=UPI002380E360|nr:autotransporter domain-containing protein [Psychrobacter sp. DAB_AL62B]MDE4455666.1 autotransporter domain-containing protein [Psychrobacter sp. DAB_AL62B]